VPDGEFFRIETPEILRRYSNVGTTYEGCTFDRKTAMRRRKAQLLGLGHPLIDALITHLQSPAFKGEVSPLPAVDGVEPALSVRLLLHLNFEDGRKEREYRHYLVDAHGSWQEALARFDLGVMKNVSSQVSMNRPGDLLPGFVESLKQMVTNVEAEIMAGKDGLASIRTAQVGLTTVEW